MAHQRKTFSKEDCQAFNELRMANQGKTFSYSSIRNMLGKKIKCGCTLAAYLLKYPDVFHKTGRGSYQFKAEPLHIGRMQAIWDKEHYGAPTNKPVAISEESAIELLKNKGYKIMKMEFDYDRAMANPNSIVSKFISWAEV